jgi:hypothetical protein
MVASSGVVATAVTNRAVGAVSFVLGIVTIAIGAFSSSYVILLPRIAQQFQLGLIVMQQFYDLLTVVDIVVAVVAVILGIIGVWRSPRSSLAAWGIGVGGAAIVLVGFGILFTAVIDNLLSGTAP